MNTSANKNKKNALGRGLGSLLGANDALSNEESKTEETTQYARVISRPNTTDKSEEQKVVKTEQTPEPAVQVKVSDKKDDFINKVISLPIEKITGNKDQPRKVFDKEKLAQLSQSIKENGVIQPITVKILNKDQFEIIAGERRWRASQMAGLHEVPAIVKELSAQKTLEVALVENIQREDLNPIEEAKAYKNLMDEFDLTQSDVAQKVGKERATIANVLRLLNLSFEVMEMVKKNEISMGHAKLLLSVDDRRLQHKIARKIFKSSLSVKQASKLIKRLQGAKVVSKNEINSGIGKQIQSLEQEMQKILGTKVNLKYDKGKSKVQIQFYSVSELNSFVNNLRDHWKN